MTDIRWKQRFQNFESALQHLEDAMAIEKPDLIQKAGMIQFLRCALSWLGIP